jgi:single-stranded-DNA-specific exonuclease
VEPEALLALNRIDRGFFAQMQRLEPFGIGHPAPLFWSCGCEIESARLLRGGHLQLQLAQGGQSLRAMAWRWQGEELPCGVVDVAYHLRLDRWQGQERLQLELVALRPRLGEEVVLQRRDRTYWCRREGEGLVIRNAEGEERRLETLTTFAIAPAASRGETGTDPSAALRRLFHDAAMALGLAG